MKSQVPGIFKHKLYRFNVYFYRYYQKNKENVLALVNGDKAGKSWSSLPAGVHIS